MTDHELRQQPIFSHAYEAQLRMIARSIGMDPAEGVRLAEAPYRRQRVDVALEELAVRHGVPPGQVRLKLLHTLRQHLTASEAQSLKDDLRASGVNMIEIPTAEVRETD